MAIKSNEIITANDINTLKAKIKNMYNNRSYLTQDQKNQAGTAIDGNNISAYANITKTNNNTVTSPIGDIINACLVINDIPNLKQVDLNHVNDYINKNEYIFGDGSATDLLSWLSDVKRDATGTSNNHGCRGACVGICTATCFSQCTYECLGSQSADDGTSGNNSSTGTQTNTGCTSCDGACLGSCKNVCYTSCNKGCKDSCGNGGCTGGCSYACRTTCAGGCHSTGDMINKM